MKRAFSSRLISTIIALVSMLFVQLAVAGYVCPSYSAVHGSSSAAIAMIDDAGFAGDMIDCSTMDHAQPNLCHAFTHTSDQSLDKPGYPNVLPFVPSVLTLVILTLEHSDLAAMPWPDSTVALHVLSPPLSITNCCFRI